MLLIAHVVCLLLAPITPFPAEEIWDHLPKLPGEQGSIHLTLFPQPATDEGGRRARLLKEWEQLLALREEVTRALGETRRAGTIGSSVEAAVHLKARGEAAELLRAREADLPALFIVSKVTLETVPQTTSASGLRCAISTD